MCGLNSERGRVWSPTRFLTQFWPLSPCLSLLQQLHVSFDFCLMFGRGLLSSEALPGRREESLLAVARRGWSSLATGAFKCLQETQNLCT